jgi:hypothetical protein
LPPSAHPQIQGHAPGRRRIGLMRGECHLRRLQ